MEKLELKLPTGEKIPEYLFKEVLHEINEDCLQMMHNLWLNWTHLGVNINSKEAYVRKLVVFAKNFHQEVLSETREKIEQLKKQVDKSVESAKECCRMIPTELRLPSMKHDQALVDYHRVLQKEVAYYEQMLVERREKLKSLQELAYELDVKMCSKLQEEFKEGCELPSDEELAAFEARLEAMQAERDRRMQQFVLEQAEIRTIMNDLKITPETKFELMVVSSTAAEFVVSDAHMARLARFKQELHKKYDKINNMVLELRERLSKLWHFVDADEAYRATFLQLHPGCHAAAERAVRDEIDRCERIKQDRIKVRLTALREEISSLWERCLLGPEQRKQFAHYETPAASEELLTLHELYLQDLQGHYLMNKEIYELYETRKQLWTQMSTLEARASDPGRYHNRGGQLLREEKERNAIATKLPKIEEQLSSLLAEYEATTGSPFTANGRPLVDLMREDWENRKTERTNKLSARKLALTPRGATPRSPRSVRASTSRAPGAPGSARRTPLTVPRKRASGRAGAASPPKRKLQYGGAPRATVPASSLRYKRTSNGRRSGGGHTPRGARARGEGPAGDTPRGARARGEGPAGDTPRPSTRAPPAESFLEAGPRDDNVENIHNYTEFMNDITGKSVLRSTNQHDNLLNTPTAGRGVDGGSTLKKKLPAEFAPPRTPLSAKQTNNLARTKTYTHLKSPLFITPETKRSKTQLLLSQPKTLPPLI